MKNNCLLIIVVLLMCSNTLFSQEDNLFKNKRHRIGFNVGIGGQACLNVKYEYQIIFYQAQYYYAFLLRKSWGLDLLIQPQYNTTTFRLKVKVEDELKAIEFGINAGVLIRKNFLDDFMSLYFSISGGPHYISETSQRQHKGFVFSDNLFIGLNIRLLNNIYLDIRTGFRHISNAGISVPNRGINNSVIGGGIFINL